MEELKEKKTEIKKRGVWSSDSKFPSHSHDYYTNQSEWDTTLIPFSFTLIYKSELNQIEEEIKHSGFSSFS